MSPKVVSPVRSAYTGTLSLRKDIPSFLPVVASHSFDYSAMMHYLCVSMPLAIKPSLTETWTMDL